MKVFWWKFSSLTYIGRVLASPRRLPVASQSDDAAPRRAPPFVHALGSVTNATDVAVTALPGLPAAGAAIGENYMQQVINKFNYLYDSSIPLLMALVMERQVPLFSIYLLPPQYPNDRASVLRYSESGEREFEFWYVQEKTLPRADSW